MNILLIGSGGREHALAWKIAQSEKCDMLYVAPGSDAIAQEPNTQCVAISVEDIDALVSFAEDNKIELVVIGPEAPLVLGLANRLRDKNIPVFGPEKDGAQIEGSKGFMKDLCAEFDIPTARYARFTNLNEALPYIEEQNFPLVIKADGLAAGKGVIVANNEEAALVAVRDMLGGDAFGSAGHRVVIEAFMSGEEASFIIVADGERFLSFATSQDHKRRDEGDLGPNTGGMGAYSPAPVVSPEVERRVIDRVIAPTIAALAAEGMPYRGFLYAGLMIDAQGNPRVVEFNCRFGDPEAQPVLARLRTDLVELCRQAACGRLEFDALEFDPRTALGVVMAAGGYPAGYDTGAVISGLCDADTQDGGALVFHAGTVEREGEIVTAGGRVLCVVGIGESVTAAASEAYGRVEGIGWVDAYYRRDIGHRAIARASQTSQP